MNYRIVFLLLSFVIIVAQPASEEIRSVRMSSRTGWKFPCVNTTCVPFLNVITPNILKCRMACLAHIYCRAASFRQPTRSCDLFTDMSNQMGSMLADMDVVTMVVSAGTRYPPEPTTTSTATTTTSTSTTATTTTTALACDNCMVNAALRSSSGADTTFSCTYACNGNDGRHDDYRGYYNGYGFAFASGYYGVSLGFHCVLTTSPTGCRYSLY